MHAVINPVIVLFLGLGEGLGKGGAPDEQEKRGRRGRRVWRRVKGPERLSCYFWCACIILWLLHWSVRQCLDVSSPAEHVSICACYGSRDLRVETHIHAEMQGQKQDCYIKCCSMKTLMPNAVECFVECFRGNFKLRSRITVISVAQFVLYFALET